MTSFFEKTYRYLSVQYTSNIGTLHSYDLIWVLRLRRKFPVQNTIILLLNFLATCHQQTKTLILLLVLWI